MNQLLGAYEKEARLNAAESAALALFRKYCMSCGPELSPGSLDPDFFQQFFTEYLPKNLCQASDAVINSLYPVVADLCRYLKMQDCFQPLEALYALPPSLLSDFTRVLKAKSAMLRFIKSPILNKDPLVVDLHAYALKKQNQPRVRPYYEKGYFQVADMFSNHSVVLRKLSEYNFYVRLYLNKEIISTLKPQDVLQLTLRDKGFLSGWAIEEVSACYLGELAPEEAMV